MALDEYDPVHERQKAPISRDFLPMALYLLITAGTVAAIATRHDRPRVWFVLSLVALAVSLAALARVMHRDARGHKKSPASRHAKRGL